MLMNVSIKKHESEPLTELVLRGWQWHGPGNPARTSQDSRVWVTEKHSLAIISELCLVVASQNSTNKV